MTRQLVVNVAQGGKKPNGESCGNCKWGDFEQRWPGPVSPEELRRDLPDALEWHPEGFPAGMALGNGHCRYKPLNRTRDAVNGIKSWCGQWTKP